MEKGCTVCEALGAYNFFFNSTLSCISCVEGDIQIKLVLFIISLFEGKIRFFLAGQSEAYGGKFWPAGPTLGSPSLEKTVRLLQSTEMTAVSVK